MSGMFGGSKAAPAVKATRMPVQSNPSVLAAQKRQQEAMKNRGGRSSTILTDALRSVTGSRGNLGA